MQITTIRYGYTFNRNNYQSERIDLEATIDSGESWEATYYELRARVFDLGGDPVAAQWSRDAAAGFRRASEGK